jgi:hypothetical protein
VEVPSQPRRSLRTIAAELAALGHLGPSGQPYHASSIRHTCSRPEGIGISGDGNFAEHMVPAYGAGMTLEKGDLRCVIADPVRLIGILKIFVSKYQNQEIGEDSQCRYATLHLPDHVAHAMNSAPQVRQRFPSRSLKPLPTHTEGFD